MTVGFATRLWYQSGFVGAPAFVAKTNTLPSLGRYIIGVVWRFPDFAPVVLSRSTGAPSNWPPTLPLLARNSSTTLLFQSFISDIGGSPPRGSWRRWSNAVLSAWSLRPGGRDRLAS